MRRLAKSLRRGYPRRYSNSPPRATVAAAEGGPVAGRGAAATGSGDGSRNRGCYRCLCGRRFSQQGCDFRIGEGRQALAATARLFGGDGGLAPLLSFRHPLGNFRADRSARRLCRHGRRRRRCSSGCRRRRAGLYRFTQQRRHFRIVQRRQALAAAARLLGGDGGLAPLLSFRHPFGDFFADASRRCGRSCGAAAAGAAT